MPLLFELSMADFIKSLINPIQNGGSPKNFLNFSFNPFATLV